VTAVSSRRQGDEWLWRAYRRSAVPAFIHLPIRGELVEVDVAQTVWEWTARTAA